MPNPFVLKLAQTETPGLYRMTVGTCGQQLYIDTLLLIVNCLIENEFPIVFEPTIKAHLIPVVKDEFPYDELDYPFLWGV